MCTPIVYNNSVYATYFYNNSMYTTKVYKNSMYTTIVYNKIKTIMKQDWKQQFNSINLQLWSWVDKPARLRFCIGQTQPK